ncbi:MAG: hypothetical protein CFK48_06505 [Armatimonadetes bacterium CP1_7O]|jgi:hypothetical protein|nr:MAG: hypothetical protein CFK48_06505 [Armatimonadetes bacterium CP1_7O]
MQAALEILQEAIQHALALGLGRAGGLEPLRDAQRALQPYDALAPLAESLQRVLETDDTRVQLNELTRLYYACDQALARLHAYTLPTRAQDLLTEPTRQTAAPALEDTEPFAALFRGDISLAQAMPAIYERIARWRPEDSILPLQLTLAHSSIAHIAIEKLQSLGSDALPLLIRLAGSKNPLTRLRACELLLERPEPKATAALRSALTQVPRALPLFQKLRSRTDLHQIFLGENAPTLEQWLAALHTREQLRQMLQRAAIQIMLQPPDSAALRLLSEKLREFARFESDYLGLIAAVPHERVTQYILVQNRFSGVGFQHFVATLDYRLTPMVLNHSTRFWGSDLDKVARLGDAAFLPHVLQANHNSLRHYGEPAQILKQN